MVLHSRQECWGLVINEAASFGTPIVSTYSCGAIVEFLNDKYSEFMAKPNNPEDLYQKSKKEQKGITLIALIITIIVMLILVGVSVTVALNNGLFKATKSATDNTLKERDAEQALSNGTVNINGEIYQSIEDYIAVIDGTKRKNPGDYDFYILLDGTKEIPCHNKDLFGSFVSSIEVNGKTVHPCVIPYNDVEYGGYYLAHYELYTLDMVLRDLRFITGGIEEGKSYTLEEINAVSVPYTIGEYVD